MMWMAESYDHIVRDWEELVALRDYIAANPGKGGLSENEFLIQAHRLEKKKKCRLKVCRTGQAECLSYADSSASGFRIGRLRI